LIQLSKSRGESFSEVLEALPLEELFMWQRYYSEPRGDHRADYHTAQICQMINLIAKMFEKGSKPVPALDKFLLVFKSKDEEPELDKRKQFSAFAAIATMFDGMVPDKKMQEIAERSEEE